MESGYSFIRFTCWCDLACVTSFIKFMRMTITMALAISYLDIHTLHIGLTRALWKKFHVRILVLSADMAIIHSRQT